MRKILTFIFGILAFSCTEKLDFDQYDDLSVEPTLESSLVYIESPESLINQSPNNFYNDIIPFDAFNEEYFAERVVEGSISYEIQNTTSKHIRITLEFLDATDNILDIEYFDVSADPAPVLTKQTFYGSGGKSLNIIRNLASFRATAENLGDNTSVSMQTDPTIILKSSAKFTVRVK